MVKKQDAKELTSRQRLAERYKGKNPDLNVDDDEALGSAILGDLDAYDKSEEQRRRLNETIQNSDIAPEMMAGIMSGKKADGSPFDLDEYLLDEHLDYLLDYMENNETAKAKRDARKQERKDAAKQEEELKAKVAEMTAAEDAELDAAITEAGYKPEQVKDLIDWIYDLKNGFITRAANFDLKKDDFLKLFKIKDYDVRMAEAEDKGYKRGRNEKIDMFKRGQKRREDMPADLDGGGGGAPAGEQPKEDPTIASLRRMKKY